MESSSSSSASSCTSLSSFEDVSVKDRSGGGSVVAAVKFLCSYGGKILPRYPEGKLRYIGGETRVLTVDRSIPYSELQAKMGELCGWGFASLRCQLPAEDLDALVSVTCDEDLAHLIEEYDVANRDRIAPSKIRAFLYPSKPSPNKASSPNRSGEGRVHYVPSRLSGHSNCVLNGLQSKPRHHHHHHQYYHHHHDQYLVRHGNRCQ